MILGVIRLAPGRAAFYDDLTNIHLTQMCPEANVYAGMNTVKLKRGVYHGTIKLVSGSLDIVDAKPLDNYYIPQPQIEVPVNNNIPAPEINIDDINTVEQDENKKEKKSKKDK